MLQTLVILILLATSWACSNSSDPGPDNVIRENGQVVIVDRTGKRWDVTHAETQYGMKAEDFQFGLGPEAIRPILNPEFLLPGDPGYPDRSGQFLVIGTDLNNDPRAYPIDVLTRHEVIDEVFGNAHVAVAY